MKRKKGKVTTWENIIKTVRRLSRKVRIAITIAFATIFFGLIITGFTDFFPKMSPLVKIIIGILGLLVTGWFGFGVLKGK